MKQKNNVLQAFFNAGRKDAFLNYGFNPPNILTLRDGANYALNEPERSSYMLGYAEGKALRKKGKEE